MKTTAITGDTLLTAAAVEKVCPTEYGKFRQALSDRPIKTLDEFKDLKENIAAGDAAGGGAEGDLPRRLPEFHLL